MSNYTPVIIAGGLGAIGVYLFYQEYIKAKSNTKPTEKLQQGKPDQQSEPSDPQLLRRSMQVLEIYSKNYMETSNIIASLRHIIKLYTSEILKSKTLAQNLLADGIIDKLFSLLSQTTNSNLQIDIYCLLSNFLCSVSGDLPALIIIRQKNLLEVGVQKGLQNSCDVQSSCLIFLKNLTVRDGLLELELGVKILDEIMKLYKNFDTNCKVHSTSVINNLLRSDLVNTLTEEQDLRDAFTKKYPDWFRELKLATENIESEKLASNLNYLEKLK